MSWKKSWKNGKVLVSLLVLSFFLLACTDQSGSITIKPIWDKIITVGQLHFLGSSDNALIGFMRILVAILVFALLFEGGRLLPLGRNAVIAVAAILAIMSAVFIPGNILAGIGGAYATVVAFVLIGIPIAGGGYALIAIPGTSRGWIALRIAVILLLLWILISVKTHALKITGL